MVEPISIIPGSTSKQAVIRKSPDYQAITGGVQHPVYVFACEECGRHTIRRRRPACYLMVKCPVCKAITEHA